MIDINHGIIKTVKSLGNKKDRDEQGLFVAEGVKCVRDTWDAFSCRWLIGTRQWYERFGTAAHFDCMVIASRQQMERMSQFSTASDVIAVYEKPVREPDPQVVKSGLNVVLDNVQDPGNLGTIIRLADWFGISKIFAGAGTVDVYNHKVVQATMGAIARVAVHYVDLDDLLDQYADLPVYGTFLNGDNIYKQSLEPHGFVVFGNEGQGISSDVAKRVKQSLFIPSAAHAGSESLNVGVAAAVTISEFMRTTLK